MCMMDASRGGAHGDAENIIINVDHEQNIQIKDKESANNNANEDTKVQFFHDLLQRIPVNKVLSL